MQRLLALAAKDESLRLKLIEDPIGLADDFGLKGSEVDTLRRLSIDPYGHSPSGLRAIARMLAGYDDLGTPIESRYSS